MNYKCECSSKVKTIHAQLRIAIERMRRKLLQLGKRKLLISYIYMYFSLGYAILPFASSYIYLI
jgi:hypothetical protein